MCMPMPMGAVIPLLIQAAAIPPGPPQPDFKKEVDYIGWVEKYATEGMKADQNAAALYTAIFGEPNDPKAKPLPFDGPRSSGAGVGGIGPWNPVERADWEKAHQATKEIVQKAKLAAGKPHAWWGMRVDPPAGQPKLVMFALLGELSKMRGLAKGVSENGWRAADGQVNEAALVASCRAQLGMARQVERNPALIAMLVGIAIRAVAYEDLLAAADLGVLSEKERANVLAMLKSQDGPIASIRYWMNFELAMGLDVIQAVQMKGGGRFEADKDSGLISPSKSGSMKCDGPKAIDAYSKYIETLCAEMEKPYDADTTTRLDQAQEACRDADMLCAIITPALSKSAQLHIRGETMRRATRLVYEILAYHDKNQKWPAALKDLLPAADKTARIDPFSNKPFAYKLVDGKPLLYSVGLDAKDDGGTTHDEKWGDETKDADYIIWPVQR